MYYVYILRSQKDRKLYIGYTSNLKHRLIKHQKGLVKSTRPRLPMELIFYEFYINQKDALRRERYLKTNQGKKTLKIMLHCYFESTK